MEIDNCRGVPWGGGGGGGQYEIRKTNIAKKTEAFACRNKKNAVRNFYYGNQL